MSNNYDNTNRGALWINQNRRTDKHPDLSGSVNIEGVEYWISGWTTPKEERGERKPIVSLSVTKKEDKPSQSYQGKPSQAAEQGSLEDDFEDDIPF